MEQTDLYNDTCFECSKLITARYSTSFSIGIRAFDERFRNPVYAIYGFVRLADEIVDTFHQHNKHQLISHFRDETFAAIHNKISLNPVLQALQLTVHEYGIDTELIEAFLLSMETDLGKKVYDQQAYDDYIFGSAEVIGLMCLRVFCKNEPYLYSNLYQSACKLGSAFQKINFLRDAKADLEERGRVYFPGVDIKNFSMADKRAIEADIKTDLEKGFEGIKQLPVGTRLGVYIAYRYYLQLFKKLCAMPAAAVLQKRVRVSDTRKMSLYCTALLQQKLNMI